MPIKPCQSGGKPGYRWGDRGKCYTYEPGDEASRRRARRRAIDQALAIGGGRMPAEGGSPKVFMSGRDGAACLPVVRSIDDVAEPIGPPSSEPGTPRRPRKEVPGQRREDRDKKRRRKKTELGWGTVVVDRTR